MEGMALGSRFSLSAACKKQQPGVTARGNLNDACTRWFRVGTRQRQLEGEKLFVSDFHAIYANSSLQSPNLSIRGRHRKSEGVIYVCPLSR